MTNAQDANALVAEARAAVQSYRDDPLGVPCGYAGTRDFVVSRIDLIDRLAIALTETEEDRDMWLDIVSACGAPGDPELLPKTSVRVAQEIARLKEREQSAYRRGVEDIVQRLAKYPPPTDQVEWNLAADLFVRFTNEARAILALKEDAQ
jgi:hypothetical protein